MINVEDKNQSSERAINSKEPPKQPADRTDELADWRQAASYLLARGARSK
jgi:hypothetical protein